jgi:tRNA (cmo5U34)-methyltransferase
MEIDTIAEQFNRVAREYDAQRKRLIPCFEDFYGTSVSFLAGMRGDFRRILDLGAGTGLLTKYLYDAYPKAHFTLVDVSDRMLEVARERFRGLPGFEFIIRDYSRELPPGRFDLVASALSIHHLEDEEKRSLYERVHRALDDGGCFINLDQFNASSETMNGYYNEFWYRSIDAGALTDLEREALRKRRELDRENTIDGTKRMLAGAGFTAVECIYCYYKFGVVAAVK